MTMIGRGKVKPTVNVCNPAGVSIWTHYSYSSHANITSSTTLSRSL